ncbi:hypothetical protein [Salinilacihabitans rarus]|uniref:hypothetical protein n=1 Tax=Salinilacihabitans rarus TaxID=2961596 RepID=UPI0020C83465|nr:hypothetical protein [Salinilacihabitans rarus]
MADTSRITRRAALGLVGGGALLTAGETLGVTSVTSTREVSVSVNGDSGGFVGLLVNDQVRKNRRERLVDVTNNTDEAIDVTVSLSDCGHGALYGPDGVSGCTVEFGLAASGLAGDSKTVEVEAAAGGISVPFAITATSSALSFEATRSTDAAFGTGTDGAVEITTVKKFRASAGDDDWTVEEIEAVSNDEPSELDHVAFEVRADAGDGDVVGTFEESAGGNEYLRSGSNDDPAITIEPDGGHGIDRNAAYELTVTVSDTASNFDSATELTRATP